MVGFHGGGRGGKQVRRTADVVTQHTTGGGLSFLPAPAWVFISFVQSLCKLDEVPGVRTVRTYKKHTPRNTRL